MKKRFLALALATAMVFTLAACGSAAKEEGSSAAAAAVINGPEDLVGKTVAVQSGTTGDIYVSDQEGVTVERYNKGYEAVQALLQGKVDAVVIDNEPAQVFVSENKGLKILDKDYTTEDYAIAMSKDKADLLEKVNGALKQLQDNGVLDQIKNYYIGDNADAKRYEKSTAAPTNGKLIMGTNAEFPPYEFREGDEIVGIDADMAQAVADILGMELEIEDMAFDSILAAVQGGKIDMGVAGMTVTEDRLKSVNFSSTYCTGRQVIIVKE